MTHAVAIYNNAGTVTFIELVLELEGMGMRVHDERSGDL